MTKARNNADNVSGDISEVTAGTGITVSSGTGPAPAVALTTPVASTNGGTGLSSFTTGDIIYSSSGNTLSKLGIGTTSQVLTVAGGLPTWAAAASGATFVGCILDNTTDISVSSSTSTLLTYDTETADTNAFHSTSSNTGRITIPSGYAGKYFFIGSIESSVYNLSTNSGLTSVALRKNGSTIANAFQGNLAGYNTKVCVSWVGVASVGDYYELYAYQNSGGTRTIYYNSTGLCQFAAYYLG